MGGGGGEWGFVPAGVVVVVVVVELGLDRRRGATALESEGTVGLNKNWWLGASRWV